MHWMGFLFQKRYFVNTLYVLCACFIFFIWIWTADSMYTSFNGDPRSKLSDIINGTAHRPFVQRALIPVLTQAIYRTIPDSWSNSITLLVSQQPKFQKEMLRLGWEDGFIPQYLIALILSFVFLALFPFVIQSTVRLLYETNEWIINMFPLLIMLGIPMFFHAGTRYIYDFPALSLFALGFYFMLRRHWYMYYLFFLIGLVNKETMVILAILFAFIYYKELSPMHYWRHLIIQCGLFVIIRGSVGWIFKNNPGRNFEFHFFSNIRILADLWTPQQLIICGIVLILLIFNYYQKPIIARKAFYVAGISFFVLTVLFGYINEIRDVYEFYPFFGYLILHTIFFSLFHFQFTERNLIKSLQDV